MKTEINNFLEKCPFVDFSNIKNVHNYIGTFLVQLNQNAENILRNSLAQKAEHDFKQLSNNRDLQNIALYNEEIRKILYYIETKYICNKKISNHTSVLHKLVQKSVIKLSALVTLYFSSNYDDFYSVYRSLYEYYVIFSYMLKNEDLADAFIDHGFMTYYIMLEDLNKLSTQDKEKMQDFISNYGESFKFDYGWAQKKLNKKSKVLLTDIIENCDNKTDIEKYSFNYSYACKFIHASSYAAYAKDNTNVSPLIRSVIEMINYELLSFIDYLKTITRDNILLKKLVLELSKIVESCIKFYEK